MPDFPTFNDLFRIARDEILVRNGRVSRDAIEREGMDANLLVAAAGAMADEVVGQIVRLSAGMFLDSAKGEALERLVFDRYGLLKKAAAASFGTVQFSTTSPAPATFTIPLGTKLATPDGVQFITTEAPAFVAGSTGPVSCMVRSVLAGADQNVRAGQITSILDRISSAPTDLVVTNPLATAGADAAESDDSLRDRARRYFTTVRRGTLGALEEAALSVEGVRTARAFEALDAQGRPARFVQLVVADAFAEQFATYDTAPPRYATQSQAIASLVFNALSDVRPAGVYVQVLVANVVLQPLQLALTFNAGADVNQAALEARAAVVGYVNGLKPGETFVYDNALEAMRLVPGLARSGNAIVSPAGNVSVRPLQAIRTSLGLVSALAAQTDQPIVTGDNPDAYTLAGS